MRILGIDYGRSKMGLAFADGTLAAPLKVVHFTDTAVLAEKLKKIITDENIDKVVIGVSDGEMGRESLNFSISFGKMLDIPVETFDESFSTQEAQALSKEAGIHQKKRHEMEDAYAATIMLQDYLDSNS